MLLHHKPRFSDEFFNSRKAIFEAHYRQDESPAFAPTRG